MRLSSVFNKFAFAACLSAAASILPGTAVGAVEVKLAHDAPETHLLNMTCMKFKEVLEAESNGRYTVSVFHSGQMGGDRELIEAAQMGNLTAAGVSSSPLAAFNKDFFVLDAPFLFSDRKSADAALDGELGQLLLKSLEQNNLTSLALFENGFRFLTNSRRPVYTPDDARGLKLRVMNNAIHLAIWKALGANPTPMSFNEVFTALQQKTIDGQENPTPQIWTGKLYEVQKYMTKTYHIYTPYLIVFNKDFYDGLPEEDRKLFESATRQMVTYSRALAIEQSQECEDNIAKAGVEIIDLTPEQIALFREKTVSVLPMIEEKLSPEVLAAFRKLTQK